MRPQSLAKYFVTIALLAALIFVTTGCPGDPPANATPEERQAATERLVVSTIATALDAGATGIQTGIDTVHALRVAGAIEAAQSLELARLAKDTNSSVWEGAELTLSFEGDMDASEGQKAVDKLERLIESGQRLNERGTLHIKNNQRKIIFAVGSTAAISFLRLQKNNLQKLLRTPGLRIRIDDASRKKIEGARTTARDNQQRLDDVIKELEGQTQASVSSPGSPNPSMVLLPQPSLSFRLTKRVTATVTLKN